MKFMERRPGVARPKLALNLSSGPSDNYPNGKFNHSHSKEFPMTLKTSLLALAAVVALGTTALTSTPPTPRAFMVAARAFTAASIRSAATATSAHHGHFRHRHASRPLASPPHLLPAPGHLRGPPGGLQRSARHLDQPLHLLDQGIHAGGCGAVQGHLHQRSGDQSSAGPCADRLRAAADERSAGSVSL